MLPSKERIFVGARLDRLPASPFHYRMLMIIGLGMFFDGFDVYILAGIIVALVKVGWTNIEGAGMLLAATNLGAFLGSLIGGYLCDKFGRRTMYKTNLLIYGFGSMACAIAPNYFILLVLRVITGLGMGAQIPTGYSTFGEFVPPGLRGKFGGALALVTNLSQPAALGITALLIPMAGWRWVFVVGAIPALLVWWVQRSMPESPRWLESIGKHDEADCVLDAIEAEVESRTGNLPPVNLQASQQQIKKLPFSRLFSISLVRRTIFSCLIVLGINLAIYGFTSWLPTMLIKEGLPMAKSLIFTTIMVTGAPLGVLLALLLIENIGRRLALILYTTLSALSGYGFVFVSSEAGILILGFLLIFFIYAAMAMTFSTYVPELFPTSLRASGTGFSMALGRLGVIFFAIIVAHMLDTIGVQGVILMIASILLLCPIITILWGEETRGKTLEEISS
jgi:putative MFS transporter